jgi:hypothetical protein
MQLSGLQLLLMLVLPHFVFNSVTTGLDVNKQRQKRFSV